MVDTFQGALHSVHVIAKKHIVELKGKWRLTRTGEKLCYAPVNYNYLVNLCDDNYRIHPHDVDSIAHGTHLTSKRFVMKLINCEGDILLLSGEDVSLPQGYYALPRTHDIASRRMKHSYEPVLPDGDEIRRKAIEEQVEGTNILEAVFNTSTLGLHVLRSIRDDRGEIVEFDIVLANATSDKIAGRHVSGMRMLECWPHTRDIGLFEKFVSVVTTGEKLEYEHYYEGDGVKAWFQWIASKLGDGLYVTIEDITIRKNAEVALAQTAARLQSTLDGVPAVLVLLDVDLDENNQPVDFIISATNKAASDATGHHAHALIGRKVTEAYPEMFSGELLERYTRVFTSGEPLQFEYSYPGLDRWFSVCVTKQLDGQGLVVVAIDITVQKKNEEHKRQNQILEELHRTKTEFFSNVSHEFRTPLTLMLAPIEDVIKTFKTEANHREELAKLELIHRNALRLEKLVNTLLNFSRIEAGKSDAIFKPTDIAQFTTLIAGNFRSAIESAGLKFVVDCECTEPVYVNPDMWEKIVLNLLSNALKFTFHGKIEVRLRSFKKRVRLEVSDTGIGINPSNQAKIFDKFVRIINAKSRSYEGSGIGLALVKDLVNIHGGSIEVDSKEGEGSTFYVSLWKGKEHLPAKNVYEIKEKHSVSRLGSIYSQEVGIWSEAESLATTIPKKGAPSISNIQSDPPGKKSDRTILLVDDNADVRQYIKSIFDSKYTVTTAHNGARAMELIESGLKPDLILADVMMPEMDGYALLNKIRQNDRANDIHFIMLSARASEEDRIFGLCAGVDDYVVKPFSSDSLLALVTARIDRNRTRRSGGYA